MFQLLSGKLAKGDWAHRTLDSWKWRIPCDTSDILNGLTLDGGKKAMELCGLESQRLRPRGMGVHLVEFGLFTIGYNMI